MNDQKNNFFASAYLTLISIIQATTFGIFVFSINRLINDGLALDKIFFLLCEFITIISLTYSYFVGSRDLIWDLDIFDISIPFILGIGQSLFIVLLGNTNVNHSTNNEYLWFVFNLIYIMLVGLSLANAWYKTKKEYSYYESNGLVAVYKEHIKQFRLASKILPFVILCYLLASILSYYFIGGVILQNIMVFLMIIQRIFLIYRSFTWDKHICQIKNS